MDLSGYAVAPEMLRDMPIGKGVVMERKENATPPFTDGADWILVRKHNWDGESPVLYETKCKQFLENGGDSW